MAERWRKPATVLEIETSRQRTQTWVGDPRGEMEDYDLTLDEESTERVRLGYLCIDCLEPQETPFPEACSLCGYPMRSQQAEHFARTYRGIEVVGPSVSLADEIEMAQERASRLWTPGR